MPKAAHKSSKRKTEHSGMSRSGSVKTAAPSDSVAESRGSNSSVVENSGQYIQGKRNWPSSHSSWEMLNAGKSTTRDENLYTIGTYSNAMTPLDRWRNETQQQSPWNNINSVVTQNQNGNHSREGKEASSWSNEAENGSPFCQISITPSPLPQGLRDPPIYAPSSSSTIQVQPTHDPSSYTEELPSYSSLSQLPPSSLLPEKSGNPKTLPADDVLHFLDHENDTLTSLSLRYGVPISELRRANGITSDHLLLARRTVIIPGSHYKGGVSLSPRPVEGEEEERRKGIIRRWMVACKVSDYDIALLYLEQFDYNLEAAIDAYIDDERWEREHPLVGSVRGKSGKRHNIGRTRFLGQK
ncbi:hypothetical protein B7463_g615, partial [Scytalidium lignicola]